MKVLMYRRYTPAYEKAVMENNYHIDYSATGGKPNGMGRNKRLRSRPRTDGRGKYQRLLHKLMG